MRGNKKFLMIKPCLLFAMVLLLFISCDDGMKMVMIVLPDIEHSSSERIESPRVTAAYLNAVHNFPVLLSAGDGVNAPVVKVVRKNLEMVRMAFVKRRFKLLHDYCEKHDVSVIFYTQISNTRTEDFFQVKTHFFDDRSGAVYHFRPYLNVDVEALYRTSFWNLKLREMYRKLSGEQS